MYFAMSYPSWYKRKFFDAFERHIKQLYCLLAVHGNLRATKALKSEPLGMSSDIQSTFQRSAESSSCSK